MNPALAKLIMIIAVSGLIVTGFMFFDRSSNDQDEDELSQEDFLPDYDNSRYKNIYLAGGCFWGVEAYFSRIIGVEYTSVGYANGIGEDTSYRRIDSTGHAETVKIVYDPERITLEDLVTYYYGIIEPTSLNRQGNDRGTQYRSGIYYSYEADLDTILGVTEKEQLKHAKPIVTEIEALKNFVLAEDYHQDYLYENPGGYCHVNLSVIPNEKPVVNPLDYPKPGEKEIKQMLTPLQFEVTQRKGTEAAFQNRYWDNKEKGLYVDIVTGEPLFLSKYKYDSGTGWPSFTEPIDKYTVKYYRDQNFGMERVEVRSRVGGSHLGHVFRDGPVEEGGLRFCINSAALDFISYGEMDERGYGRLKVLFE
ncbi:peptide-methionine (R)-S-oxide reductase MsrB [Alkalibacter saccharofermentans]|uniref:Peptide methionine sulfoxide reductase MsrA n=1 Tax=Alkalibacter saccharofermentans DSM 14828 TaxID=1120975 RepID=A0A1M4YJB0_9FIRM|nr:peptide-methionine (R)-S-oxide reductase MsrB [Alkalibacter saccharofermentans]SHF05944.1 peptide methionine sulfoxide reductase msrA/msrB [Alkalibacter saccharofermentans DSM 14828]